MTVSELFTALGGPAEVARILQVGPSTASEMKRRGSIPVSYWPRLISGATERQITGLDYEALVHMHVRDNEQVA